MVLRVGVSSKCYWTLCFASFYLSCFSDTFPAKGAIGWVEKGRLKLSSASATAGVNAKQSLNILYKNVYCKSYKNNFI